MAGISESPRGTHSMPRKIIKASQSSEVVGDRPNVMRPKVVGTYLKSVLDMAYKQVTKDSGKQDKKGKNMIKIIERIY